MKRVHVASIASCVLLALSGAAAAQEDKPAKPLFTYDATRTDAYFSETLSAGALPEAAKGLASLMKAQVVELAQKDWGPWQLLSHPVNQGGNRFTYYNCPDELLVALALARPWLDKEAQAAATKAADREFRKYLPINFPWKPLKGELRGWHDVPESVRRRAGSGGPWLDRTGKAVARFETLYGVWAYAHSFDRWDMVEKGWPLIRKLKQQVAAEYDFKPKWNQGNPNGPGVLTAAIARSRRYRHGLLRYLYVGTHGFYGNAWPRDEHSISVFAQFGYVKLLSALIGYGRIAERMGHADEARWAKEKFDLVARQALTYRTAPYYWSSPWLTPEVGRLLRDNAGEYLDEVKKQPNVLAGTKDDGFGHEGPWYVVIDPHHWYTTHAGSNGAAPPCSPMSGFLAQAYLMGAPPEKLDDWTDIPLCQADYWYVQKCAVAITAYGAAKWERSR